MKLLSAFILLAGLLGVYANLEVKYSWKVPDFEWNDENQKNEAIASGGFIPINNAIAGFERWENKLFLTIPRGKLGVASSLNYIDLDTAGTTPLLKPYPKWHPLPIENAIPGGAYAEAPIEATTIVNAFHPFADVCNRLWVLDNGVDNYFNIPNRLIPPTIVLFDLTTDEVLHRFPIPSNLWTQESTWTAITVDVEADSCDDAFAYLPNLSEHSLLVYSLREDHAWTVTNNYFSFDPLQGNFTSDGITMSLNAGLFGQTLGPQLDDGSRDLYFHAIASVSEFKVNNRALQNESYITSRNANSEFIYLGNRGVDHQVYRKAYDETTDVIFYGLVNTDEVACWNINKPYTPENIGIVDGSEETLVFPIDVARDHEDNIWVLSNHYFKHMTNSLNADDVNYRVLSGESSDLVKGTVCDTAAPETPVPAKPTPAKPTPAKPAPAKPAPAKPAPAKPAKKKFAAKPAQRRTAAKKPVKK